MMKITNELIEKARRQVGHIVDKSMRERLISDLADALEASLGERDDLATRLSEYLCDSTGGLLSKTGYDVRTMLAHTEEYYDRVHAEERKEVEAERDAALAAIEVTRKLHHKITRYGNDYYSISAESYEDDPSSYEELEPFDLCAECYEVERLICEECGGDAPIGHRSSWPCPTIAALDGAPEPEATNADAVLTQVRRYLERFNPGGTRAQDAMAQALENILEGEQVAWAPSDDSRLPVEGEKP